jgi:hypothetical protein
MSSLDDLEIVSPSWLKHSILSDNHIREDMFPTNILNFIIKEKKGVGISLRNIAQRHTLHFKTCDFLSIPKCGSTSIRLLYRWCWDQDIKILQEKFSPNVFTGDNGYDPWNREFAGTVKESLILNDQHLIDFLPKFAVVRDPYERCISSLKDILTKKLCNFPVYCITADLLSDFIENVPLWVDPHLWPAYIFVHDVECTKILLDNINIFIEQIHENEYSHAIPYPWLGNQLVNRSRVPQTITFDQLRPEARTILEKYYTIDFEKGLCYESI